mgnify:FL=1
MIACENSGHRVSDDFAEVSKIVEAGELRRNQQEITNYPDMHVIW